MTGRELSDSLRRQRPGPPLPSTAAPSAAGGNPAAATVGAVAPTTATASQDSSPRCNAPH